MLSINPMTPYDPKKMVRLQAVRPLFANEKRIETDEIFEVAADQAGYILATLRAKFADEGDRHLVYKQVSQW